MLIENILQQNEVAILDKWIDAVLVTYSEDSARIFKSRKDRFANPIGYNVKVGLEQVYRYLYGRMAIEEVMPAVENLIKIRAVQKFIPSAAVSFIFLIKELAWTECNKEHGVKFIDEWPAFAKRVDDLALSVFDFYMQSRERLHQIRIDEMMRGTHTLTDGTKCGSGLLKRIQKDSDRNSEVKNHEAR